MHKIQSDDFDSFYVGKARRPFEKRFEECLTKNISEKSRYLIIGNHDYNYFNTNLKAIDTCKKGRHMNALKEYIN